MNEFTKKIDCFVLYTGEESTAITLKQLKEEPMVGKIFLMMQDDVPNPFGGCEVLRIDNFQSTRTLHRMADVVETDYALVCRSLTYVQLGYCSIRRMLSIAESVDASVTYSDRYILKDGERIECPTMDFCYGSVRDDFDFGPLSIVAASSLRRYRDESLDTNYNYSARYDFQLFCLRRKRNASLYHIREYLYTEVASDKRTSGEKQFDYVLPNNREVQKEREVVFTEHLKKIGVYIDPESIVEVNVDNQKFDKEASVIIPVRNRVKTIEDAVRSALSQKTSFEYNVIVVDNHSTDGTTDVIARLSLEDSRVVHLIPERTDLGIGGCWSMAFNDNRCGRFAVQLDSDDLYSGTDTLQRIVDKFYEAHCGMVIGSYRMCNFNKETLPPGLITHSEWTPENGHNNALRVNGLGAPRAFYTPLLRSIGMPNTSYGEDYAVGLAFCRQYKIGRIYDELYLCRRWEGNSDANLTPAQVNANNAYKDGLRTIEIINRRRLNDFWQTCMSSEKAVELYYKQLPLWPEAASNYEKLQQVLTSDFSVGNSHLAAQYNPARIVSTKANIDPESVKNRTCFLCEVNRPPMQISFPVLKKYYLLLNPNPILPQHFTIALRHHAPQSIKDYYEDMMEIAVQMKDFFVFYNGPKCGASAPDHMHLQAGTRGIVPLERDWTNVYKPIRSRIWPISETECLEAIKLEVIADSTGVFSLRDYPCPGFVIVTRTPHANNVLFNKLYCAMSAEGSDEEPMMNILSWVQLSSTDSTQRIVSVIIPRSKHRPDCYFMEGEEQMLISPGAIDMAGLLITPREEDFRKMTASTVDDIIKECGISRDEELEIIKRFKWGGYNKDR